jgi:hypothetical protein
MRAAAGLLRSTSNLTLRDSRRARLPMAYSEDEMSFDAADWAAFDAIERQHAASTSKVTLEDLSARLPPFIGLSPHRRLIHTSSNWSVDVSPAVSQEPAVQAETIEEAPEEPAKTLFETYRWHAAAPFEARSDGMAGGDRSLSRI